ncbi:MAG: hypothetical protein UHX00_03735 [Caryophanon sp.]|nr:hypothetical protein [Caryophanon sp.]
MTTRTIYVVMTATRTWLSRTIQLVTRDRYNHVSIALDPLLHEMYSFGRRYEHNPFIGGFTQESRTSSIFQQAYCAIYSCVLPTERYIQLRKRLRDMKAHSTQYQYHFLGLFALWCGYKWERENTYFCSHFVATLFQEMQLELPCNEPFFMRPNDFACLPYATCVYEGPFEQYVRAQLPVHT